MRFLFLLFIILSGVSLSACVKKNINQAEITPINAVNCNTYPKTDVLSYDRYTLVNLTVNDEQRLVLNQIVEVSIPKKIVTTVSNGMNYLLKQSGFTLCHDDILQQTLFNKQLPAIQYKLGPIRLSDALQVLAGPAFELTIDNVEREVCFQLAKGYTIKNLPEKENNKEIEGSL